MSATFIKIADRINHTPVGALAAGAVVAVGGIIGVALEPIAAGAAGTLAVVGEFELTLASGKTFAAGDPVYVASSEATDSGTFFGYAIAASASGVVRALLVQSPPEAVS